MLKTRRRKLVLKLSIFMFKSSKGAHILELSKFMFKKSVNKQVLKACKFVFRTHKCKFLVSFIFYTAISNRKGVSILFKHLTLLYKEFATLSISNTKNLDKLRAEATKKVKQFISTLNNK